MPVPRMGELWMKPGMPTLKEVEQAQREDEECRAMMDYLSKKGWERNDRKELASDALEGQTVPAADCDGD